MINNLKIIDKSIFTRGVSSYTTTKDLIEIFKEAKRCLNIINY